MDKKLEESSEKTANLRRKKYTSPVPWSLFVGWNRPVWTLIKNMKSPDLWFLHCKTKNSRKLQKYPQCLESSKFEDKKSALLGLEPLLVEIEHFLDTTQKYETPGFFIFKCQNAHFSWKVDIFETTESAAESNRQWQIYIDFGSMKIVTPS